MRATWIIVSVPPAVAGGSIATAHHPLPQVVLTGRSYLKFAI